MDPLNIVGAATKAIFGAFIGFFIGTLVQVTHTGIIGTLVGAVILGYLLFAPSALEILGALIPWLILLLIEHSVGVVEKLISFLPVAQVFGGNTWGKIAETAFSWMAIYLVALVIVMLIWGKVSSYGPPQKVNWGCGAVIGLVFTLTLLCGTNNPDTITGAGLVSAWAGGGALFGLLISFIPGPPLG